jgi:hypothetical protein
MNQVHTLPSYLRKTHYNILTSTSGSSKNSLSLQGFPSQYSMHFPLLTCMSIRRLPHPPLPGHPNSHEQFCCMCHYLSHCQPCLSWCSETACYNNLELSLPSGELSLTGFVVNGESSVLPRSVSSCQNSYVSHREPLFYLCHSTGFVAARPGGCRLSSG